MALPLLGRQIRRKPQGVESNSSTLPTFPEGIAITATSEQAPVDLPVSPEQRLRRAIYDFVRDNQPPGHLLGPPVRDPRHVQYRALINFGRRTTPPTLLPPHAFEVYLGRHLLGTVVQFTLGDWGTWPAAKGHGLPLQTRRAAARQLLALAHEHGVECDVTSNDFPCAGTEDRIHRCHIAPLGREHFCRCVCGNLLD